MGLLDFLNSDDARLGISLLGAAAPTMQPMGFGTRLNMAMRDMDDQSYRKEQMDMAKEYRASQIANMKLAMEEKKRKDAMQEAFLEEVRNGATPQAQPVPLPQLGEQQGTGPYRLDVDTPESRASIASQIAQLEKTDPMAAKQVVAALVKQGAIPPPMQQLPPDMNRLARLSMLGQLAGVDGAKGMMDFANFSKPDWQQVDSGGQIQFVNKNGQQMPVIGKTMSPDAVASNQLGWAKFGFDQEQFNYGKEKDNRPVWDSTTRQFISRPDANNPTGVAVSPSGVAPRELTGEQAKAQGFLGRMAEAEKLMNNPKTREAPSAIENVAGSIPIIGNYAANASMPPERQVYKQAQEDWVRAKLRKESGAVIGKDEMEQEIRTYFPQQGDSPEVIAQKTQARFTAIQAMATEGGPNAKVETPKPRSKAFQLDGGGSVIGQLGADGKYYTIRNGKKYEVKE